MTNGMKLHKLKRLSQKSVNVQTPFPLGDKSVHVWPARLVC